MMPRKDKLGRVRRAAQDATQFRPARPGAVSRSHNVNASPDVHAAFARLTPQERGDLIAAALAARS